MTNQDLTSLAAKLADVHETALGELSTSDQGSACLDDALSSRELTAVDFDLVKDDWYARRFFHQVRSCDALYKAGSRHYLIEFKTGKPENLDLHRKLYDSVFALMEHRVLSLEECRANVQYVIVSRAYEPFDEHREMLEHFERDAREPWDYDFTKEFLETIDRNDIRRLSGFLVNKIYKLSPQDFDKFASNRNWCN